MHLLVVHTTSKTLLNMVHVIVCYVLWPTKIKLLDVFNAFFFFGCEKRKEWGNLITLHISLKNLVLKIIWSYEHSCHIIKTVFQMILHKIFLGFFKNFCFFVIQPIEPVSRPIEMWRRKMAFSFKSFGFLLFLLDSFRLVEPIFMCISIIARFLSTNRIWNFKNI